MKLKVINIVNHAPAYDGHRGRPRPKINWDTPNGSWVGIWGYEWHDILGNKVLSVADDIEYEVWQPDHRADKIYEHTFESGLVHRLYPAKDKKFIHGFHTREDIYSEALMDALENEVNNGHPVVLHINAGLRYINIPILKKFHKKIPIVGQFYTNSRDTFAIPDTWNPFKLLNGYKKKWELLSYYKMLKFIIPSIRKGLDFFENKFGAKVFYRDHANFGSNFDDWTRKESIDQLKDKLNIPKDKYIMFSSSRLIPIKQIDKMLMVLSKLEDQNFICYISGRGTEEYEAYLNKLLIEYKLENKAIFIGYVDFDVLQEYFIVADLLLSTSFQDAGPASPFQASATNTAAFITDTGIASEFFQMHGAGVIVPINNYQIWIDELNAIMKGREVKIPSKEALFAYGDWKTISAYYYNIYKTLQNVAL